MRNKFERAVVVKLTPAMHKIVLQKPCAHCGKMHYTNVPGALVVNEEYYCQLSCAEAEHPQLNKEIQPQLPFFEGAD